MAPLHEVEPIACFVHGESGEVIGGAIGRRWGSCCELQQLWVDPRYRRRGIGSRLVLAFEAHAQSRGCSSFSLETFSFQSPRFYRTLGYEVAYDHPVYPHGIVKSIMVKHVGESEPSALPRSSPS
ncbi:GNAT family N-acetyltransferase [Tautonia rosea]|uniref:GNAT family N-acetyltransferase n=1 Tax=Tautonia rosea TaxID=2728037 RepID=UPI0019D25BB7